MTTDIPKGVDNFKKINGLMDNVADTMNNLVKPHKTGLFSSTSALEAMQEVVKSTFFSNLNTIFDNMKTAASKAADIKISGLQNIVDFLKSPGLDNGIVAKISNFKSIFSNFKGTMDLITAANVTNINNLLSALSGADAGRVTATIHALNKLGEMASEFKKTADAFERMANALTKMSNNEGKLSRLFGNIRDASNRANKGDLEKSANAAIGGVGLEGYVEGIYTVINDWNTNGIPVRAQLNQATGEIQPKDVGNSTGNGGGRK